MIIQKEITLGPYKRGFHLITRTIENQLSELPETGLIHIHLKHTSAALALNENADPSVRQDFLKFINHLVPEDDQLYSHSLEGTDDMPAHLKSALFGQSLTLPISRRRINLGTWQGIYFCEFRDDGGSRDLVITIIG